MKELHLSDGMIDQEGLVTYVALGVGSRQLEA